MTAPRQRPPDFTQYDGLSCWHDSNGLPHSENDFPAITKPRGEKIYYHHGVVHRDFGPAHIHPDGREEWFHHGQKLSDAQIIDILRSHQNYTLTAPRLNFSIKPAPKGQ